VVCDVETTELVCACFGGRAGVTSWEPHRESSRERRQALDSLQRKSCFDFLSSPLEPLSPISNCLKNLSLRPHCRLLKLTPLCLDRLLWTEQNAARSVTTVPPLQTAPNDSGGQYDLVSCSPHLLTRTLPDSRRYI